MATLVVGGQTFYWQLQVDSPYPGFGEDVARVTRDLDEFLREAPDPAVFWVSGNSYVPSFLGATGMGGPEAMRSAALVRQPFWLVTGRKQYAGLRKQFVRGELSVLPVQVHKAPHVRRNVLWKHDLILVRFEPADPRPGLGTARASLGAGVR